MASNTKCIEVSGLPPNAELEKLKVKFENYRRGGGRIQSIELNEDQHFAVITFENSDSVESVLQRSEGFKYDECKLKVRALPDSVKIKTRKKTQKPAKDKEEEKVEQTTQMSVKATVDDVTKPKDFYLYYLEDHDINDGEFDDDSIFLDGLHKSLFVTFFDRKDARAICRISHEKKESNIIKMEIAAEEDFNYYNNLISLHGFSFETEELRNELKQHIRKCTGKSVKRLTQYDEPRSAIVKFPSSTKKEEISSIAWKCAGVFKGVHIITSPVYKNNILKVSGLGGDIAESSLKRYLTNKRSGGRPEMVNKIEHMGDYALVTLDTEEDVENILQKKDHELENKKLKIEHYHPCLTPEVYKDCMGLDNGNFRRERKAKSPKSKKDKQVTKSGSDSDSDTKSGGRRETKMKKNTRKTSRKESDSDKTTDGEDTGAVSSETKPKKSRQKNISSDQSEESDENAQKQKRKLKKEKKGEQKSSTKKTKSKDKPEDENQDELFKDAEENADVSVVEEEVMLSHCEITLLDKTGELKKLQAPLKSLSIQIEKDSLLLKGDKKAVKYAQIKILSVINTNFVCVALTDLNPQQTELLKNEAVQKIILDKLERKNCFASLEFQTQRSFTVYYPKQSITEDEIISTVRHQVIMEEKPIQREMVAVFQSMKGENFLKEFCGRDGLALIELSVDPHPRLLIIASSEQQYELLKAVDKFIEENKINDKEVSFSSGEQEFVRRYFKKEFEDIEKTAHSEGASVKLMPDKYALNGLEKGVNNAFKALTELRKKISKDNVSLKYFGAKEFLAEDEGKGILDKVEREHSCVITQMGYVAPPPAIERSNDSSVDLPTPLTNEVAELEKNGCLIVFVQGDITGVQAGALVNPITSSYKCDSSLGKTIISRGGNKIQQDLTAPNRNEEIVQTSAGNLNNFACIFHALCPKYGGDDQDREDLKSVLGQCLQKADEQGLTSIAFPAFGTGKAFGFPKMAASKLMIEALSNYIEQGDTDLERIVLCDMEAGYLKELMDRCETIFEETPKTKGELDEQPQQAYRQTKHYSPKKSFSKQKDFKHIQVGVVKGEITSQSADVIISTIDKTLDMTKTKMSKAVYHQRGDAVQMELSSKGRPGIKSGEFVQTSGGDGSKQKILHACLGRWRNSGERELTSFILRLIQEANKLKATSLAIPSMGTGGLGYPKDVVSNAMFDAISKFVEENPRSSLKKVDIVVFPRDTEMLQICQSILTDVKSGGNDASMQEEGASVWDNAKKAAGSFVKNFFGSSDRSYFGRMTLTVKEGDISQEDCEAVVIAVQGNMDISKSGAVCKSLLKKHGRELQEKLNSEDSAFSQDGIAVTEMHDQAVIHLNMEKFSRGWDKGVAQALMEADRRNLISLALPLLGAARKGADISSIKQMIFKSVEKFSDHSTSLTDIRLMVYNKGSVMGKSEAKAPAKHQSHKFTSDRTRVSEKADLVIFSSSSADMKKAVKQLEEDFKKKFITDHENDEDIKNLDQGQIKELVCFGQQQLTKVNIDQKEGSITLQGFSHKGISAVLKQLRKIDKEMSKSYYSNIQIAAQWQYQSGHRWRDFGASTNSQLEIEHQKKSGSCTVSYPTGRKYLVDLAKQEEFLLDLNGKKSGEPIKIRRLDQTKEEPLPKRWDHMEDSDKLKTVKIRKGSHEYKKVEQHFQDGGVTNKPIKKIERIQNRALYQQYAVKKREIERQNPSGHMNERRLFHGTSGDSIAAINENGFNRNYKSVTAFGEGAYFAVKSSYSEGYTSPDSSGDRKMYQVRVLVGQSVKSDSSKKFLPNKPGKNTPYDSGVNDEKDPTIFVIFHDAQTYPEYLITF